jgi:hypothetical protein
MLELFSELPIPSIIIIVGIVIGIVFSIIKKLAKVALFILSIGILLLVVLKLASGYFGL